MNIAIITDTYFPDINGVTSSIYTLSEALKSQGHCVYIFTVSEPKSLLRKLKADPTVYRLPSLPLIFLKPHRAAVPFSVRMLRMMRKLKIDIIHTQTEFFLGFAGLNISTSLRIPVIHTYHTMLEDYTHYIAGKLASPRFARQFSKVFCNLADSVIVPTSKVEKTLHSYGVTTPIYVIPTGINLAPFSIDNYSNIEIESLKKSLGIDPSHKVILCLGRVAREKSIHLIISEMPNIIRALPDAKLLIVGDGPALPNLRALAKSTGVENHVTFSGAVPYNEIAKYYRLGDVFMSCSITETQGLTYYEAMASGLPIVARQDDSLSSILENGVNCRLFSLPNEIPAILSEIFSSPETAARYSEKARESIAYYSASTFGQRVEEAYRNTIQRVRLKSETRKGSMARIPVSKVFRTAKLVMPAIKRKTHRFDK